MLSQLEFDVLSFLRDETRRIGFCPSVREIAAGVKVNFETTRQSLISLHHKGFVRRVPDRPRAIAVLRMPEEATVAA